MPLNFTKKNLNKEANLLFFQRLLKNPLQVGALVPSSRSLARVVGREVSVLPDQIVIELGGGTGTLTEELLKCGIPEDQLYVIEIDLLLVNYMKKKFPNVTILHGNATDLPRLIPPQFLGKTSSIISGMPFLNMPKLMQKQIIEGSFECLSEKGRFIQYTYSPFSSLPAHKFGLSKHRAGIVFKNFPPATIWRYEKTVLKNPSGLSLTS